MPSNLAASLIQLLCSVAPVLVSTVSHCLHNFCLCASTAIAIYHCCICCAVEAGYPLQLLSQQHSTAVLGARTDSRRETSLPLYPVPGYPCKIPGALPGQSWGINTGFDLWTPHVVWLAPWCCFERQQETSSHVYLCNMWSPVFRLRMVKLYSYIYQESALSVAIGHTCILQLCNI